ncbi:MAG TPA: CYTH and CHAD domain-containing protein, partial [Ilumatobacteraceae bacterium]|nr:CYTH and CHAD domain-containing protein [Ilumatobacteraceae bacterium]
MLPDLNDADAGVSVGQKETLQLEAVYYDTPTLSLARWGVTLRTRTGERGPVWTLKLPVSSSDSELSRHEIMFDEPLGPVPAAVRRAVTAYTRSQTLGPVVRLQTERTEFVVELHGRPLAKVCDDTVVADGAAEPISVFREIEVELIDSDSPSDAASAVSAILARLRGAGCKDDEAPVPKVIRALGPRAFDPPDVAIPKVGKHATVGALVRNSLAKSVTQLIEQHAKVCVGSNPEDLHQFRVASRRLRSDLRTYAPLLDRHVTKWLRDELGWLGREVGVGRDADVLADRLRAQLGRLPDRDAKPVTSLLKHLADTSDAASDHVLQILTADRYLALLDALVETARQPHFSSERPGLADRGARSVLGDLALKPWRRLD